ncbi:hypothetical protein JRQ81_011813 [Phrynocephalus forsythii]|uniref:Uncharacterized protein n=1 Tax=Phrynocephalus forsythii TaxID=171643 RepID=A0A9Q1AQX4_9SAUR|nr:hypothetical protein JRQ81_011813 [Phrynocephalus forsythii]
MSEVKRSFRLLDSVDYDQIQDVAKQLWEQMCIPSPHLCSSEEPHGKNISETTDESSSPWESTVEEDPAWISVGNCLHKTTVLAGITFFLSPLALPRYFSCSISLPVGVLCVASCTIYGISWLFDPCGKYQVEDNPSKFSCVPEHNVCRIHASRAGEEG